MTEELDLRGEVCPYTYVRTKLKLEEMESGEDLIVLLDDAIATANVSKSLRNEGHQIEGIKSIAESVWEIRAKKG